MGIVEHTPKGISSPPRTSGCVTCAEPQLAARCAITSIPTLMVFRDGILVFSQPGALAAPQLEQLIDGARSLDMDHVRRQLAERSTTTAQA